MSLQPSAAELLLHLDVIDGLRRAYEESGVGTDHPVEQGGFILCDPDTATFVLVRLPAGGQASLVFPLRVDGTFQGKQIVGSFHTHPNTGLEWQQEPSPQDIRLSQDYPETMGQHQFVIAKDTMYHIDNDGEVTILGSTPQLLELG
ncbi:MAG: hypothetical protein WD851_08665 [Pirellulales bacterium]